MVKESIFSKGIIYKGDWINNKKYGIGIEIYKDGNKYENEHKMELSMEYGLISWVMILYMKENGNMI